MSSVAAFAVWLQRPEFGLRAEHTEAMDLFVLMTLCCLFFLLGCFGTMAWVIWRRTVRPKPHIRLLMELEDEQAEERVGQEAKRSRREPCPEPWEKQTDWWKR